MYCKNCGQPKDGKYCPNCGYSDDNVNPEDKKSIGFSLIGFLVPVAGLVLYILYHDSMPLRAKSAGKGALASVILSVIFAILYIVLIVIYLVAMGNSTVEILEETQALASIAMIH